jgi:tetratricopeptide (TPR) repeat protein
VAAPKMTNGKMSKKRSTEPPRRGLRLMAMTSETVLALPDFDMLWDYNAPAETESRFRAILADRTDDSRPYVLELKTQIARCLGLQRRYDAAHALLNECESDVDISDRARIRYFLERGRLFNSSGNQELARPLFEGALELANRAGEDAFAVDAAHMLAIVAEGEDQLNWNVEAIRMASASSNERAQGWLGALHNNVGWSYFDAHDYEQALESFRKGLKVREERGEVREAGVARWTVARALRALGRTREALDMQLDNLRRLEESGGEDGYVSEEIGECLLELGKSEAAAAHFARAAELLAEAPWFVENESERLARNRELGLKR